MTDAGETSAPEPSTSRREIFGWCMFDFANSSYTTVVVSVVFGPYFIEAANAAGEKGDFLWGLSGSISMLLVLVTAPFVGAVADFTGTKKRLLFFTYLGCVGTTALLYFAGESTIGMAMALFILSNFFFSSGENLVAAFLPEIATHENMGRISGYGWAVGYFGGLASLFLCLPLTGSPELVPWCFPTVALFFLAAGIPTFLWVRERRAQQERRAVPDLLAVGFTRVVQTLRRVRQFRQLFLFLVVFLMFNAGVMIVIFFASPYAREVIGMTLEQIIFFFLIVQISAAVGAFLFGRLQDRVGARWTIMATLLMWCGVAVGAYVTRSQVGFYLIGNVAGMAMGATQSGSRALVGLFSPAHRTAEFFGFWGLFWKMSGVIGPLTFGVLAETYGYPNAILSTVVLFVVGFFGMFFVDEEAGKRAARDATPRQSTRAA